MCPCGSGKKYKKCCLGVSDVICFNYKNQPVMINKKKNNVDYKKIIDFNKSITPDKNIMLDDGLILLREAYAIFDDAVEILEEYTPCNKGCNACCRLLVETTAIEAELIKRYVLKSFDKQKINMLEHIFRIYSSFTPTIDQVSNDKSLRFEYFKSYKPCPFLVENGECLIYEVRPINCRTYYVFSDPKICEPQKVNRPVQYGGGIVETTKDTVQRLDGVVFGNGKYTKIQTFPYWFKNGFNITY